MARIHLISGPRNISTALMYAFGNREDMTIVDEPMYAYYLKTHPEIEHPGSEQTLASMSADLKEILSDVIYYNYPTPHVFFKNMGHHLHGTDWSFVLDLQNVFLIREPAQLIASFAQVIPEPTLLDIGLQQEYELMQYLEHNDKAVIVLDSNEVLKDPKGVLNQLCHKIHIPFSERMLKWEPGPRKEDGTWAKYWYANVHKSTGFKKQKTSSRPFPQRLKPLLDEATFYYQELKKHAIMAQNQ